MAAGVLTGLLLAGLAGWAAPGAAAQEPEVEPEAPAAAGRGRVAVYFDLALSGSEGVERAATALAEGAAALTAAGPVEVVAADPLPELLLPPTGDPLAVAGLLRTVAAEAPGSGELAVLRLDYREDVAAAGGDPEEVREVARDYLDEELELVRRSLDGFEAWLTAAGVGGAAGGPGVLVLVSDGFDLDPRGFYLGAAASAGASGAGGAAGGGPAARWRGLAERLAAAGWRVVGVSLGEPVPGLEAGGRSRREGGALEALARATGGAVAASPEALAAVLAGGPEAPSAGGTPVGEPARRIAAGEIPAGLDAPEPPAGQPGPAGSGPRPGGPPAAAGRPPAAPTPPILLLPPRSAASGRALTGRQRFQTLAVDPGVARAVFWLDGAEAASDDREPFTATLDLGAEPRPHRVRVVAFSAGGRQLGEHALEVNPAAGPAGERPLAVAISRLSEVPGEPQRLAVEVEVSLPAGATLDRVEVWYGQTLAATLDSPPFRATLELPGPPGPADYVRAVAVLADGSSVDDARLLGAEGASERLAVNLVELFVVATDHRTGAPVTGLGPEAFTIRAGGGERPVESFRVADEVPLELGVLIDTSESMWPLMPDTKKAASKFLAETLTDGDRAFLVDFATKPRLVRAATGDLLELLAGFGGLEAGGATALYDSIVFATTQFADVAGRRAVVLLTDGADYGSRFGPRRSIEQAQAAGAPVYVVSLAGLWSERGTARNNDLEGITGQTGGRIFYISDLSQLDSAYAEINAELRSQYVLAYSTERPLSPEELAKIEVRVEAPGRRLDARTVAAPGR